MVWCCDVTENTLIIISSSRYAGIDLQSRKDLTKRQDDRCISPPFYNPLCLLEFQRQTQTLLMSRAKRMRRRFQATMHSFFFYPYNSACDDVAASRVFLLLVRWFLKTCDIMFLEWERPFFSVYISVMLHQNSFRVDKVLHGFDSENSMDSCVFGEMASFP